MKRALAVSIVLGLAAGLFFWLSGPGGNEWTGLQGPPASEMQRRTSASALEVPGEEATARPDGAVADASRTVLASSDLVARSSIRVIDARNGTPAVGAEVRWVGELPDNGYPSVGGWFDEYRIGPLDPESAEERAKRSDLAGVTDDQGRVDVHFRRGHMVSVVGRSGRLWGWTKFWGGAEHPEVTLQLHPTAHVKVRVVDAQGAPAVGVPVCLFARGDDGMEIASGAAVTAEPDGIAVLRHAGYTANNLRFGPDSRWHVGVDLCLAQEVFAVLDETSFPSEPVTLMLPPTGQVEIRFLGEGGAPCDVELPVSLAVATGTPLGYDVEWARWRRAHSYRVSKAGPERGSALFPRVGLGLKLNAMVRRNAASSTRVMTIQGPTEAGQRVTVDVIIEERLPSFRAQLLKGPEDPLSFEPVVVELVTLPVTDMVVANGRIQLGDYYSIRRWRDEVLTTKRDGAVCVDFAESQSKHMRPMLVFSYKRNTPEALAAAVDLAGLWTPGVHDLGEVVLVPPPIRAAGRVLDEHGTPVGGVSVSLMANDDNDGVPRIRVITDPDGRFELRDAAPCDEDLDLWVETADEVSVIVDFVPGATNMEIRLPTAED